MPPNSYAFTNDAYNPDNDDNHDVKDSEEKLENTEADVVMSPNSQDNDNTHDVKDSGGKLENAEADVATPEGVANALLNLDTVVWDFCKYQWQNPIVKLIVEVLVCAVIGGYVLAASILNYDDARPILALYIIALVFLLHRWFKERISNFLANVSAYQNLIAVTQSSVFEKVVKIVLILFYIVTICAGIAITIYWNYEDPIRLKPVGGLVVLYIISFIYSKHRSQIKWRTVFWGLTLQFVFGIFVLRTDVGFKTFDYLGKAAQDFLDFSLVGINFVFQPGGSELPYILGITTLMVIPFFAAFISAMYHIGLMQYLVAKLATVLQVTMGTSATESISAAGNIFVGATEAPLLVKPYLETMTLSELHAIMTGGFATIAGGVFAAYVSMGVSASHLISASVMSAPAALTFSKIVYPETVKKDEEEKTEEIVLAAKSSYKNVIHAVSSGAVDGMTIVLHIMANLIAFLSLLEATNYLIEYLGDLINISDLTLYLIFQYVFYPIAFLIGADSENCLDVGELLGLKTIANEFVAYDKLSQLINANKLTIRSTVISTYALCGFSNFGTIGIQIGGLGAIAPSRKTDLAEVSFSAFVTGNIACFSTACIAGLLYK